MVEYKSDENNNSDLQNEEEPYQKPFDLMKAIYPERRYLTFTGFYPYVPKTYFNRFIALFAMANSFIMYYFSTCYVFANASQINKIAEAGVVYVTWSLFHLKLLGFFLERNKIRKMEETFKSKVLEILDQEEQKILDSYVSKALLLGHIYYGTFSVAVFLYAVYPATTHGKFPTPLAGKFPFKLEDYIGWVYFSQIIVSCVGAGFTATIDMFFLKLVTTITALFDVLCERIKKIDVLEKGNESFALEHLKQCVIFYSELLELSTILEESFSIGIFFQFMGSGIIICFTGFRLLLIPLFSIEFSYLFLYLICMTWQVATYCWIGQIIMEKSNSLTDACYNVSWNGLSLKVQKMLIIIMERAKKPVILKAGGFFDMNLATLMTILKTSYSYLTLLQTLAKK